MNDNVENIMIYIYRSKKRLKKLEILKERNDGNFFCDIIDFAIKNENNIIKERFDSLKEYGITQEDYKKYIDLKWLDIEGMEYSFEKSCRCYKNLKFISNCPEEINIYDIKHPCGDKNCSYCKEYIEVTQEQIEKYIRGDKL